MDNLQQLDPLDQVFPDYKDLEERVLTLLRKERTSEARRAVKKHLSQLEVLKGMLQTDVLIIKEIFYPLLKDEEE